MLLWKERLPVAHELSSIKVALFSLRYSVRIIGKPYKQLPGTYRITLLLKSANCNFGRYEMLGINSIRFCDARKVCSDSNPSICSRGIEEISLS